MPKLPDTVPQQRIVTEIDADTLPFPPPGPADQELEWFFTMAESDMGARSNYAAVLDAADDLTMEDRAEAAHAQRQILKRLREVGDHDAGVLKAAYVARPWPLVLREGLGRVTGVLVRLACVDLGLPEDDAQLDALERRTADRLSVTLAQQGHARLAKFHPRALAFLERAFRSYVRERGGLRLPAIKGIS